jgi:hypothetical protein
MRKARRVLAAVSTSLLAVAVPATRAFAAFAPNSFTVTTSDPSGMAADGETVQVNGYYTTAAGGTATVTTYECLAGAVGSGNPPVLDKTQCDTNFTAGVNPDPSTHAFTDYIVYDLQFTTGGGTPVDCGATSTTCVIVGDVPPGDVMGYADDDGEDACNSTVFSLPQTGSLTKQTAPAGAAPGSTPYPRVAVGQRVNVTLTSTGSDYDGSRNGDDDASDASDCVEIGGVVQKSFGSGVVSWHAKPGPGLEEGGPVTFISSYTIPSGTPPGSTVCDRGLVSGIPSAGKWVDQASNIVCFTVGVSAIVPEARWPVALPIGGALAGGAVWVLRRRRRPAPDRGTGGPTRD